MKSSEIRLRKLKLRLRDKRFTNHKAPCTAIWQQPLQLVLALRSCSATGYVGQCHVIYFNFSLNNKVPLFVHQKSYNKKNSDKVFLQWADHRYDLVVTSLPLTQRARVRSPVDSISWLRFFRGFPSTAHISSVYGRGRSLSIAVVHGRRYITNNNNKKFCYIKPTTSLL